MEYNSVIGNLPHSFAFILLAVQTRGTTILIILLLALITLSFIISGAEVALFSLNNKDINMLKTKQHPSAKRIVTLLAESKEVYTSLMIAGTFINISIIVLSNFLINGLIQLETLLEPLNSFSFIVELLIKVFIIAFVIIFFCKILPKVWATQNNLRFAYGCSSVVEGIHLMLSVVSKRMVGLADNISKNLGADKGQRASLKELDQAIDFTDEDETSLAEKNILKGIVKFGNINVKQIMRSRLDICGIEYNLTWQEVLKKVEELHFSRLPVYKVNLDEVAGVINTKDLLAYLTIEDNRKGEPEKFDWHILIRPPYFVPETKLIEDLLKEFQLKKTHFAIVVDEFGGTSGIVTMEDILEEIVGEIKDEFDNEEPGIVKIDEHNYLFEGKTMIHDACRAMNLPQDTFDTVRGESESMGGLILELAGEFPEKNTVIPCGDFDFTVMESYKNRILQIKVTIKPNPESEL